MAWNHRSVWMAVLFAGFVGCWGCQPEKKTDKTPKENISHEATPPESTSKNDDEATPRHSEKAEPTPESAVNPVETPEEKTAIPQAETSVKLPDDNPPPVPAPKATQPAKAAMTVRQALPPPATIPKVSLTDKLRATCLVNVGVALPEVELADIDGNKAALKSLYGDALTVVFFWSVGTTTYSQRAVVEALGDMQKDVLEPFATKELKVVGINVGNEPGVVKEALETSGATFPTLLDPQSNYFKSVATEKLPRVYLLDASGKILWFDLEYARATRRELQTGIKAVLEGKK